MSVILNSPNVVIGHMSGGTININNNYATESAKTQRVCEDVVPEEPSYSKDYCEYIHRENLREQGLYSLDEFEQMIANAVKLPSTQFAEFLKRYRDQGNLDFHGHSIIQIYEYFRSHYPQMRAYKYNTFAAAF